MKKKKPSFRESKRSGSHHATQSSLNWKRQDTKELDEKISSVIKSSSNTHSYSFQLACQSFQSFVEDQYKVKLETGVDSNSFFNLIFEKIANHIKKDINSYFLLLSLLVDVNLGSQVSRANVIILKIDQLMNDLLLKAPRASRYLEKILVFLNNTLKTSFKLNIKGLRDAVVKLFKSDKNVKNGKEASLRLLIILLRNFSSFLDESLKEHSCVMQLGIQSEDKTILKLAGKAYIISMNLYNNPNFKEYVRPIFTDLSDLIKRNYSNLPPLTIDVISYIISQDPNFIKIIQFDKVPFIYNQDKSISMTCIPLAYRCSPKVFTNEIKSEIFEIYYNEIDKHSKKKDVNQLHPLLKSLSEFVFYHDNIHDSPKHKNNIDKLLSLIQKLPTDDFQIVAILALCTPNSLPFNEKQFKTSFKNINTSTYLVEGIVNYCQKWPNNSEKIQNKLISRLLNNLSMTNEPKMITDGFHMLSKVTFYTFSQELLIHMAQFLYHDDYKARKSCIFFLLLHQNEYPIISNLILSFIATEKITDLRMMAIDHVESVSEEMTPILFQMLHDREVTICSKALKLLCQIPNAISHVSKFVIELLFQLGGSDQLNRRVLNLLLIIKDYYPQILQPFASHLCETILNLEAQSHHSLLFLSFLVSTNPSLDINISLLGRVLRNALCSDSNAKRISSALDLLSVALKYLDMSSEYSYLFARLVALSGEVEDSEITTKLLMVISKIGPLKKSTVGSVVDFSKMTKTPNRRACFYEKLAVSSFSIPISIILEIIENPLLAPDHSTAFKCLLDILLSYDCSVTEEFKQNILLRLQHSLSNSTSLIMLDNLQKFVTCFGDSVSPLIPLIVDQLIQQWNNLDMAAIIQTVMHLTSNILDLFSPYILQFTELFLAKLPLLKIREAVEIFGVFTTFSKYLTKVDYLILPAMLDWLENKICSHKVNKHLTEQSQNASSSNDKNKDDDDDENTNKIENSEHFEFISCVQDALHNLITILQYCGCLKYGCEILRTVFILLQEQKELMEVQSISEKIHFLLLLLTVKMKKKIFPFLPQIFSFTNLAEDAEFKSWIVLFQQDQDNPNKERDYDLPAKESEGKRPSFRTDSMVNSGDFSYPYPNTTWSSTDWIFWYDTLIPHLLSSSPLLGIKAIKELAEKNSIIQSAVFPISYAVHFKNNKSREKVTNLLLMVFSNKSTAPPQVIRHFLQVIEILEITGELGHYIPMEYTVKVPIGKENSEEEKTFRFEFENIAKRALEIGEYAQALRYYEMLFENVTSEDANYKVYAKKIIFLNTTLNLPLAVEGVLAITFDYNINLVKGKFAELLGKYKNSLKYYKKLIKKKEPPKETNKKNKSKKKNDDDDDDDDESDSKDDNNEEEEEEEEEEDSDSEDSVSLDEEDGHLELNECMLGKMRCLEALSKYDELDKMFDKKVNEIDNIFLPYAASSAFHLGYLDKFKEITSRMMNIYENEKNNSNNNDENNPNPISKNLKSLYFMSIDSLLNDDYQKVISINKEIRKIKENDIFPLISTDYYRTYDSICFTTILTYIEEIAEIRYLEHTSDTLPFQRSNEITILRNNLQSDWPRRFKEMRESPISMFDTLLIMSYFLTYEELENFRIKFLLKSQAEQDENTKPLIDMVYNKVTGKTSEAQYAKLKLNYITNDNKENLKKTTNELKNLLKLQPERSPLRVKMLKTLCEWSSKDLSCEEYLTKLTEEVPEDPNLWMKEYLFFIELYKRKSAETESTKTVDTSDSSDTENMNDYEEEEMKEKGTKSKRSNRTSEDYLEEAFTSLLKGLKFNPPQNLPFTIPAISILLKHGTANIFNLFLKYLPTIPPKIWIFLLPQLIAIIGIQKKELRVIVTNLLIQIGEKYPHAILYSLLSPYKSIDASKIKRESAQTIMDHLRMREPTLVSQVLVFSNGMLRIASTFWEQWHTAICQAKANIDQKKLSELILPLYESTLINSSGNPQDPVSDFDSDFDIESQGNLSLANQPPGFFNSSMMNISQMSSTHMIPSSQITPPRTLYEISFLSQFGQQLNETKPYLESYINTGNKIHLAKCLSLFHEIDTRLLPFIRMLQIISINDAAPELSMMKNIELSVPGTDCTIENLVKIQTIHPNFDIFNSKQHPRKMWITGTDGKRYCYLLKANEDTRLDERVMQLFDFISQSIANSRRMKKICNGILNSKLSITTYKVIPLSSKVGLIGWLNDCSQVFEIFSEFRKKYGIDVYLEQTNYVNLCKDKIVMKKGEELTPEDMLEVFNKVNEIGEILYEKSDKTRIYESSSLLDVSLYDPDNLIDDLHQEALITSGKSRIRDPKDYKLIGHELQQSLIMSASDSNDWLDRRFNYATSLASTSICGYIIGLGDRHLRNIMINNSTSKLVHIDFGDSFEVAMNRKTSPEKVPFRITRMFRNALGIDGMQGTLKKCCELVLENIRNNSEQILVLLDTFLYDPLDIEQNNQLDPNEIILRINDKLTGNDFNTKRPLNIEAQVKRLLTSAVSVKNLCVMYQGWMPWI